MLAQKDKYHKLQNELLKWAHHILIFDQEILNKAIQNRGIASDDYEALMGYCNDKWKEAKLNNNYRIAQKLSKLSAAYEIMYTLSRTLLTDQAIDQQYIDYIYQLGRMKALRDTIEAGWWTGLTRHLYKKKAAHYVEKRWEREKEKRRELLEEIRVKAEDYYQHEDTKGVKKPHHVVARWFHAKPEYQGKYKRISLKKIRKVVGEVAEKYGFKSGIKKMQTP